MKTCLFIWSAKILVGPHKTCLPSLLLHHLCGIFTSQPTPRVVFLDKELYSLLSLLLLTTNSLISCFEQNVTSVITKSDSFLFCKMWWCDRYYKVRQFYYKVRQNMESSEETDVYISPPICTNWLIFSKRTFFILFFLDMPTYLIISRI